MTERDAMHAIHLNRISRLLSDCPETARIMSRDFMEAHCATVSEINYNLALKLSESATRIIASRKLLADIESWKTA